MSVYSHAAEAPSESLSTGGMVVLAIAALDFGLEQSIILPALPGLAAHYNASLIAIGWLATGFLLASVVGIPLICRLGDLFGKRRMLLLCFGLFAVGSLICAVAHSIGPAIAGRTIQGAGAAVAPLAIGLARDTVHPHVLSRTIGVIVGGANVGGGIGFLLSGVLVDWISPDSVFWFLLVTAIVLAGSILALVGESPVRKRVPIDVGGAALLGFGLAALLLAISKGQAWGWSSASIVGLFATSAVLLATFCAVEQRVRQPIVDLRLVASRPFAYANLSAFTFGFSFFLAVFLLPQIAASPEASPYGLGLSATQIGLLLVPTSALGMFGGWAAGRLVDRLGSRLLTFSASVVGVGAYLLLAFSHDTIPALIVGSAALGLGWGMIPTSFYPVVLARAATDKTGMAVSIPITFRNTAVSIGLTSSFVIVSGAGLSGAFPADAGFTRAFLLGAGATGAAALAGLLLPGPRRSSA